MTEGIIDHVRAIEGTKVAAVVRDKATAAARRARSACARATARSTSRRSPASTGAAATARRRLLDRPRATTSWSSSSATRSARSSAAERGGATAGAGRVLLCDKPAGMTSHDVVARRPPRARREGRATPARSTRSPPGCCWSCSAARPGCSATSSGCRRPTCATARLGWRSTTGDPDGELTETGRVPDRLELPTGHGAPAGADDLGGPGRRRAPLPQGPPRRGGRDARARGRGLPGRAARPRGRDAPSSRSSARRAPTSAP